MSRFEIVCVVMLAISGVIGLVGSRFIVEQQRVIDTTRAENDSLRAACDSIGTMIAVKMYGPGSRQKDGLVFLQSAVFDTIWYGDESHEVRARDLRNTWADSGPPARNVWPKGGITPADSAGVRTINDLFLRVRELERKCK